MSDGAREEAESHQKENNPPEPLNTKRGKSSGHNNPEVLSITPLQANEDSIIVVSQGILREKLYPELQPNGATAAASTQKTMAREEEGEENGRGGNLNAEGRDPTKTIYLVMPSYAEPHKKEIRNILQKEKAKLCSNKTFLKVFENVDFNIAFSNSKNIKKLVVRTKL